MTPDDTPPTLGDTWDRILFLAGTALIAMGVAFVGCFLFWTTGHMYQDLFSDAESVQLSAEPALPACSNNRVEALQAAVTTCISTSPSDKEVPCMEAAQRTICSAPKPEVVPGAGIHARDRRSVKALRLERDAYVREMIRRQYSEGQIARSLDRYDETYGSVPFFQREKR